MNEELKENQIVKTNNSYALAGFILGLVSIILCELGLIPILAIIFSSIGLSKFDVDREKNKWQGYIGLALGIIYTLASMHLNGVI